MLALPLALGSAPAGAERFSLAPKQIMIAVLP
jgi:hypothetical protein